MRSIVLAASAIALLASVPANAQAVGEVVLRATVEKACGVGAHKSGAEADPLWDTTDIAVNLTNGADGKFAGQTFENRSFGNVWCNAPANVTIEVGALKNTVAVSDTSSFTNTFDLKVTTDATVYTTGVAGQTLETVNGTSAVSSGQTAGAFETGLRRYSGFNVEVLNKGLRPIAGLYTGVVRFTATAQ